MFKWGNTGRGNVKTAILGTCRSCDPQHADCYLAGYEWCFNRPFDLAKNVQRLEPIKHAARSIKRHRDGILVWFDRHIANGLIAGIKSLVPAA